MAKGLSNICVEEHLLYISLLVGDFYSKQQKHIFVKVQYYHTSAHLWTCHLYLMCKPSLWQRKYGQKKRKYRIKGKKSALSSLSIQQWRCGGVWSQSQYQQHRGVSMVQVLICSAADKRFGTLSSHIDSGIQCFLTPTVLQCSHLASLRWCIVLILLSGIRNMSCPPLEAAAAAVTHTEQVDREHRCDRLSGVVSLRG